jgi:thiol-disulfide isomerase/thioredoxin
LAPVYAELAEKLSPQNDLIIGKMDMTQNEIPSRFDLKIKGYPTIMLFRNDGKIMEYQGPRDEKNFLHFLAEAEVLRQEIKYREEL